MKKKRRGFTLTELVAVIVILAILLLIGIPAYNSIRTQVLQNQYENIVGLIETEAAKFAAKKGTNLTNVQELIDEGLIETDDGDDVLDPRNKVSLNCKLIEITYKNGIYSSKMIDSEECDLEVAQADYSKIRILIEGVESERIDINSGEWVNEDVKLSVVAKNLASGDEIKGYRWISGSGQASYESTMTTDVATILNTTVNVEVTTTSEHKYFASVIIRVDKEAPLIRKVEVSGGNDWTRGRDIKIEATDQNGSGMYGYYVGTEACSSDTAFKRVANIKDEVNIASINIYNPTEYHVCVKDQVGNIKEYDETLFLQVEDNTPPTCIWSGENAVWTKNEVNVRVTCQDNESGCDSHYNTYTWSYSSTKETDVVSYTIKDNAGNETVCTKTANVYVDTTPPEPPTTMNFVYGNWSVYPDNTWTNSNIYAGRTSSSKGPTGATDSHSGLAKYQISSDGSTWEDFDYDYTDSMYKMSTTGTHTRYFRAVDNAGNVSTSISRTAKIDKSAPTCGTVTGQSTKWQKANRTLYQNCIDTGGSNCVKTSYSKTYTSTTKTSTMSTTISDNAGNTTTCSPTVNVYIDKTGPTITFGSDGSTSYVAQASTTISASDNGYSGLKSINYGWSTSSTSTIANNTASSGDKKSSTCSISGKSGDCYLYVKACDDLGNCNTKRSNAFKIDREVPTLEKLATTNDDCLKKYCGATAKVCREFQAKDNQTTDARNLVFVRTHCFESSSPSSYQYCSYNGKDMSAVKRRNYFINNNSNYATIDLSEAKFLEGKDNKTTNQHISSTSGNFPMCTTFNASLTVQYAFRVCDSVGNCIDKDYKSK